MINLYNKLGTWLVLFLHMSYVCFLSLLISLPCFFYVWFIYIYIYIYILPFVDLFSVSGSDATFKEFSSLIFAKDMVTVADFAASYEGFALPPTIPQLFK